MNSQDLPQPLQTLLDISKTKRIKIELSKKDTDFTPNTLSKIGGVGYLPQGENYPVKSDGTPLILLAQLNFKDINQAVDVSQLPQPLPKQGILQIYIDGKDDDFLYGCDLNHYLPHEKYQVRFWQNDALPMNEDELNQIIEQIKVLDADNLPFNHAHEYEMAFKVTTQSCGITAFEYKQFLGQIFETPSSEDMDMWTYLEEELELDNPDEYLDAYDDLAGGQEHQLLGYPNFTQTDPREYREDLQEHILLLQIETDDADDRDIMWGDSGVANFFIHPDDLKNQDFSKLLYNWDCC